MTTIACNYKMMCSDSQQTGAYIDRVKLQKVFRVDDELVGCSGSVSSTNKFITWYKSDVTEEFPELNESFSALVLTKDGKCFYWDNEGVGLECGLPASTGTGARIAMGAMMAGASPIKAVDISIHLDENSGGEIQTMYIDEGEMDGAK